MKKPNLKNLLTCGVIGTLLFLTSCMDHSEVDNGPQPESIVEVLQRVAGKTVTSCELIEYGLIEGGVLTFSDGTTVTLDNGIGAIVLLVKIDDWGDWCVSYDNGKSYLKIYDTTGSPISAQEFFVQVGVNDEGYYVFEFYSRIDPQTVIESIVTICLADESSEIQSIVRDDENRTITFALASGTLFHFNLDVIYPTSIVLLTDKISLGKGTTGEIEFRINPSDAYMNFSIDGSDANLMLDVVGAHFGSSRSFYVTPPTNYELVGIERIVTANGELKTGQFRAIVQDLVYSVGYNDKVALVLTTKNSRGESVQLSSSIMEISYGTGTELFSVKAGGVDAIRTSDDEFHIKLPYRTDVTDLKTELVTNASNFTVENQDGSELMNPEKLDFSTPLTISVNSAIGTSEKYTIIPHYSNLPILYLNTPQAITSKDNWVKSCTIRIGNTGDRSLEYTASMKGRGNSTWGYPKKPYAIKLDSKAEVLGMPKHKRWVLLANWMDRTLIRNTVAFEIGKRMSGLDWTPRGEFVEVVMNGQFLGNYYLCEQIKVDKNRVNIVEMQATDESEEVVSGGYLLELDINFDEVNKFKTALCDLPVNIKEPDEETLSARQLDYIQNYFNKVENILYESEDTDEVFDYIDMDSFIDWWLVHELTVNGEPAWPKSSYMYKDRNGKLKAGPVWDFDWGTFRPNVDNWHIKGAIWYKPLFESRIFVERVKVRWSLHKQKLSTIPDYIDSLSERIKESADADCIQWPLSQQINGDEQLEFMEAVERLRDAYQGRFEWIDAVINSL